MKQGRIATSKVLLIQYGPTMTIDQFRECFMPGVTNKTIRNQVSSGALPLLVHGVFDTQQIGDWWELKCLGLVAPGPSKPLERDDDTVVSDGAGTGVRLLSIHGVAQKVSFSKSGIYNRIRLGTFPTPMREPGSKSVRWLE